MSKSIFPILEVDGNRLTSIHGDVSWFYSMLPSDTSQMEEIESKEEEYIGLLSEVDELDEEDLVRTNYESESSQNQE